MRTGVRVPMGPMGPGAEIRKIRSMNKLLLAVSLLLPSFAAASSDFDPSALIKTNAYAAHEVDLANNQGYASIWIALPSVPARTVASTGATIKRVKDIGGLRCSKTESVYAPVP